MAKDYYETLGVRREATSDEIKRAYRRLARQLHPDVNPDAQTQERFKEVTAAYEVLADPEKRRVYDMGGDPLAPGGGFGGAGGPFGGFGFGDIMDAFFGGAGATARGPRGRARPGADALIRLEVDLAEAAFGVTREIPVDSAVVCPACRGAGTAEGTHPDTCSTCRGRGEVSTVTRSFLGQVMTSRPCPACSGTGSVIAHPCHDCSGEGRVRVRRNLTIKVPPGVESGMRIRLSGEGDVGPGGGPAGDLYVEIIELPHPVFTRDGDDLHCAVQLPMTAAALGTRARLETLEGETERIDIPAGTQSGTVVVLRGRGVSHLRGVGRGDLQVHLEVVTPTRLDPEQESLLRELARLRGEDGTDAGYSPATASSAGGGLFAKLRDAFR